MSNIKKYIVDYDWKGEICVEVDHDILTDEKLAEINNFWSGAEYRISKQGSVLNAVLVMLAQHALLLQVSNDWNTRGVVSEFSWEEGNGQEGWPPMDGSEGIKITHSEISLFDSDDISIKAA
jgi:hypothetical protein